MLGDQAYGDNTVLRERLHDAELEYVLSVGAETKVFRPETTFTVPQRQGDTGRPRSRPRPDREPVAIAAADRRSPAASSARPSRSATGPRDEPVTSRFCFVRVRAANRAEKRTPWPPREEWLIAEWPEGHETAERLLDLKPARRQPSPSSSRAWPGCAGRSSSTTDSSRASSASTTTRAAPTSAGTTTPRSSPPRTGS